MNITGFLITCSIVVVILFIYTSLSDIRDRHMIKQYIDDFAKGNIYISRKVDPKTINPFHEEGSPHIVGLDLKRNAGGVYFIQYRSNASGCVYSEPLEKFIKTYKIYQHT